MKKSNELGSGKIVVLVMIFDRNKVALGAHWKVYMVVKAKLIKARAVFTETSEEIYVRTVDLNLQVFNFQLGSNLSTWANAAQDLEWELGVEEGTTGFNGLEDEEWLEHGVGEFTVRLVVTMSDPDIASLYF